MLTRFNFYPSNPVIPQDVEDEILSAAVEDTSVSELAKQTSCKAGI